MSLTKAQNEAASLPEEYIKINPVPVRELGGAVQSWSVVAYQKSDGSRGGLPGTVWPEVKSFKPNKGEATIAAIGLSAKLGIPYIQPE